MGVWVGAGAAGSQGRVCWESGRGAHPDASSKLIIRVIYTDEFRLQTQFLLMQACPLFRVGVHARHMYRGCVGAGVWA